MNKSKNCNKIAWLLRIYF